MEELHNKDPGHNPTCSDLRLARSVAKESEPGSTEMDQSSTEETHATQFEIQTNPVYDCPEQVILTEDPSNRSIKNGHEIGTSLRSGRTRN